MKDEWYGDKRDLVKWGVLVRLAERFGAERILQVAYYRPSTWPDLEIDGGSHSIPAAVLEHFRSVGGVSKLKAGCRIEVVRAPFTDREEYSDIVRRSIAARGLGPTIVFLDPDTGLAPPKAGPEHVLESELAAIWTQLQPRDVVVLYQHQTNRNGRPWIEPKRRQFERVLGMPPGNSGLARAPGLARDVAFFFARKGDRA